MLPVFLLAAFAVVDRASADFKCFHCSTAQTPNVYAKMFLNDMLPMAMRKNVGGLVMKKNFFRTLAIRPPTASAISRRRA